MTRHGINWIAGIVPVLMSLSAFAVVLFAVSTGWQVHDKDEGAAAHLFQLLIALQLPVILIFLATADWKRTRGVIGLIVLQALALFLAFGSLAYFKL